MKLNTLCSPKKIKKKAKKRKLSDPAVNSITAYLSSSLNITTPTNSPSPKKKVVSPTKKSPSSGKKTQNLGSPSILEAFLSRGKENMESIDKMDIVINNTSASKHVQSPETPKKQKTDISKTNLENVISKAIAESNQKLLNCVDGDKIEKITEEISHSKIPATKAKQETPISEPKKKRGRPKKNSLSLKKEDIKTVDNSNKQESSITNNERKQNRKSEESNLTQDSDSPDTPKPKKNAFEFMMDSRHKSIGSNSPGKVRKSPECDKNKEDKTQLTARKKLLETWANNKGALKRKQEEIDRDEIISQKMDARAKRLKRLLDVKDVDKENKKSDKKRKRIARINSDSESSRDSFSQASMEHFVEVPHKKKEDQENEIQIYFSDENSKDQEPVFKIKMFSPQILKRKKQETSEKLETKTVESVDKNSEMNQNGDTNSVIEISDDKTVNIHIKIDLHSKKKKNDTPTTPKSKKTKTSKEIKRAKLQFCNSDYDTDTSVDGDVSALRRSSRSAKKPVKYSDMSFLSANEDSNDSIVIDLEEKNTKKNKKLAPVFAKATPKPKLDPAVAEARRKFLTSGVPSALKKIIEKEQSTEEYQFDVFPSTSHVQQKHTYSDESLDYWNLEKPTLDISSLLTSPLKFSSFEQVSVPTCTKQSQNNIPNPGPKIKNYKRIIQEIKIKNPDYPVYKTFRLLSKKSNTDIPKEDKKVSKRKKRGSKVNIEKAAPVHLEKHEMWTEKYKASCSNDILGNNKSVTALKDWLQSWLDVNDETKDSKRRKGYSSDSDFESENTRDGFRGLMNAVILTGPHGCGKTMTVYALCNELGINVIESNASAKRTGKRLLQELQEATQSHQVRNKEPTGLSSFLHQNKQKPQQSPEEPMIKRKMCVLLVEDLDIVFEQDEGFLSALGQLLTTSKRPIILTTTDITCTYLRKFVTQYPVIKFSPLSSRVLSVWLQILCLVEGVKVSCEDLAEMLDFYNGDVRKTLLQLQIFVQGGGSIFDDVQRSELRESPKGNKVENLKDDDELSFSSLDEEEDLKIHKNCVYNFLDRDCLANDLSLEKVWFNLQSSQEMAESSDLSTVFNLYDGISNIDVAYTKSNIFDTEKILQHTSGVKDSLELRENFDYYSPKNDFVKKWANTLLEMSVNSYGEIGRFNLNLPTSGQRRWINKQKDCRTKFSDLAPLSCQVDHQSYDLDYFPALRTISRSEEQRASNNVKRKNRFFNYLRSFDFYCGDAMTQTACNILIVKEGESA